MTDQSQKRTKGTIRAYFGAAALAAATAGVMLFPALPAQAAPQDAPKSERFSLTATNGKAAVGKPASFKLDGVAKGVWHFNKEFPTNLKLTAPEGVTLSKDKLKVADASKFGEKAFSFGFTAKAAKPGKHKIEGVMKFAVCIDSTCSMMKEKVTFVLDAS